MAIHTDNPMLVGHCYKKRKLPIAAKNSTINFLALNGLI
jgi:hypothetical protein